MTGTKRIIVLTGIIVLALAMLFGCSRLFWDVGEQSGGYIKLNISHPAAKGINVGEHDVTGLNIEVYDPGDQLLDTVAWDAQAGSMSYLIPVSQEGLHRIKVTHISDDNGEVVEATEYATFNIQAMVITVIDITPGVIGVINVEGGGPGTEKPDGTLTVHLTNVDAPDQTTVQGVYEHGVDPMTAPPSALLAVGGGEVMGGNADSTMVLNGTDTPWIGTGGELYDVYIWIDMNDNLEMVQYPESGIDMVLATFPVNVEINGDTHLYFLGSEFVDAVVIW